MRRRGGDYIIHLLILLHSSHSYTYLGIYTPTPQISFFLPPSGTPGDCRDPKGFKRKKERAQKRKLKGIQGKGGHGMERKETQG